MNKDSFKVLNLMEIVINGLTYLFSAVVAYVLLSNYSYITDAYVSKRSFLMALLCAYVCVVLLFQTDKVITNKTKTEVLVNCFKMNVFLSIALVFILFISKDPMVDSRYMFLILFVINLVLSSVVGLIYRVYMRRVSEPTLIMIFCNYNKAKYLINALKDDWTYKIKGLVILDGNYVGKSINGVKVVADCKDFMGRIRSDAIDEVLFYIDENYNDLRFDFKKSIEEMETMGISVRLNVPVLQDFIDYKRTVSSIAGIPTLLIANQLFDGRKLAIKRCMDIVGALVGIIISIPIVLITSVPLLIETPGPLVFRQKRVGLNGRYFYIYKLRSMYVDAEERKKELVEQNEMSGHMFKMEDDPRITKVGKFIRKTSIDELPQFFNVLKGDMSLVGTRPPTVDEFEKYESHHKRRLSMKPGITGIWQVSGRSNIQDFEEVVRMDVQYVDTWTLGLDIKILFKTILVVLTRKGSE